MKVALIAPPYPLDEAPSPPLGLCYAAAACEAAGARVVILDYIVSQYTPEKLAAELDAFQPDVIGTNAVTMNFRQAIRIIRDAKRHCPGAVTMMGGPHVSFDAENTLDHHPELDLIVVGEGEQTLLELIPTVQSRDHWPAIKGIAFRDRAGVTLTPARPLIEDLDSLPLPARHLLPMNRYLALGFPVSIITSRGCPNRCIFCLGRRMVGHKARFRSPALVVDEIEQLIDYGHALINIADDLFTANKRRVMALCDEINRRGVAFIWSAFARVNTVDPEVLKAMKSAGCHSISFGIESGNADMLKRVKKGISLDQARQAVAWSKAAGLRTHASFMVGLPGETAETLAETRRFGESLGIEHGYHFLSPFPGTTLLEDIDQYDLEILTDDWNLYDANQAIVRTAGAGPAEMNRFVAEAYMADQQKRDQAEMRYLQGNCTDEEYLTFEGFYRTKLAYKILSNDLIEKHGLLPASQEEPEVCLIRYLTEATRMSAGLVERTINQYIEKGYLTLQRDGDGPRWFWTHNNRTVCTPRTCPSAA